MCTAIMITSKNGDVVLGRTMDFSYDINPAICRIPKGYFFKSQTGSYCTNAKYSIIGTAQSAPVLTFADGVNSAGLSGAMLYFPGYADYGSPNVSCQKSVAATEVVFSMLLVCGNVKEVICELSRVNIAGIKDNVTDSIAPLHWIFADANGNCITVEKTAEGMNFYENQNGVLTNSPDFTWHLTNLRNYVHLSQEQKELVAWNGKWLSPFGQGGGSSGLPGSYTSPDRFVRTAFLKSHLIQPENIKEAVSECFCILGNVSIPKGCVITGRNAVDYTIYTVCYNLTASECYYKNTMDIPVADILY